MIPFQHYLMINVLIVQAGSFRSVPETRLPSAAENYRTLKMVSDCEGVDVGR
jgi:hypothetical protein